MLLVIQAIHRAPSGIVIISDCHMFASSDPEQMMMMMQGILPALDPDARLNLALSLSLQEGVSICSLKSLCTKLLIWVAMFIKYTVMSGDDEKRVCCTHTHTHTQELQQYGV